MHAIQKRWENVRILFKGLAKTYVRTLVLTNAQRSTPKAVLFYSPFVTGTPLLLVEDNYRYLGILEYDTIVLKKVKDTVQKGYLVILQVILKASLSINNIIKSIGAYAMPVLQYGFDVLHCTQAELRGLDTKTRKVLTKVKFHHERSDVHIIYLYRRDGGCGLVVVVDTQLQDFTKLAQYVGVS